MLMLPTSYKTSRLCPHLPLLTLLLCLLAQCGHSQPRAQVALYYDRLKPLLAVNSSDTALLMRLDSLRKTPGFSRSTVTTLFNRDIDFNLSHRRVIIYTDMINFQVDIATANGRVMALAASIHNIAADAIKRQDVLQQTGDTAAITRYLASRNSFYQSHKKIPDFFAELQATEQFAFYCGDGSPKTEKGAYIEYLAHTNQLGALAEMLASIHCETQAYAVAGFDMLKHKRKVTPQQKLIVQHIRERNSLVVTCAGCLSGLRQRIYSTNR